MKQLKIYHWFFILALLAMFSCSKDSELGDSNTVSQENFVQLSLAKEIGSGMSFKNNSVTGKTAAGIIKKNIEDINEIKNEKGITVFYVINYIHGGYIILSADNRMQPIIAFSDEGKFIVDEKDYSEGLKSWMKDAETQITAIQKSTIKQTEKEKLAWRQVKNTLANQGMFAKVPLDQCVERTTTETKGPYLKSTWWQLGGYNDALPDKTCDGLTEHVYAGCVPIAMA
ncbi:Spi family protease inhibitor [Flavobacterium sp. N1736]|uniref:Spi family protease inhibitor n=1 Tax=Flavobacterium sp. N1736 TaxID=2986823 RepID=UPI002224950C|nr:Spi family protease inhibitor [Flavobacterium sp. N1736]